jgi:hypothetical protein
VKGLVQEQWLGQGVLMDHDCAYDNEEEPALKQNNYQQQSYSKTLEAHFIDGRGLSEKIPYNRS